MELLAPAGTRENFIAALEAGADAIYLGGKVFNARANASNFTIEELKDCVRLAHLLYVPVYVTVNILIGDKELEALKAYLQELENIGVDAVIVQDLATASLVKEVAPKLAIHGSTQMTASNLGTVEFLYHQGFSRVVVSRELSIEDIRYICKNTNAEIEVFIHGALCICYSGQCLMSSMIGGRSGNRGACAQPCRLPYELIDETGKSLLSKEQSYIMSPKDLNYAAHMKALIEAGVASFKVEGRMKKVSYVREVIGAYRDIIDKGGQATKKEIKRLEKGFNRGFSADYLEDKTGRSMMTIVAPNHQGEKIGTICTDGRKMIYKGTMDLEEADLLKVLCQDGSVRYFTVDHTWIKRNNSYEVEMKGEAPTRGVVYLAARKGNQERSEIAYMTRKIPLYGFLQGEIGQPAQLTLMTKEGQRVTIISDYEVKEALKNPSYEKIRDQIGRLGNTVFTLKEFTMPEMNYLWPQSILNQMRREGIAQLEKVLLTSYDQQKQKALTSDQLYLSQQKASQYSRISNQIDFSSIAYPITVRLDEMAQVEMALEGGAQIIHFGGDRLWRVPYDDSIYKEVVDICHRYGALAVLQMPRIIKGKEEIAYQDTLRTLIEANPDGLALHCLGAFEWLKKYQFKGILWGDMSLQIFNSKTIEYLYHLGMRHFFLSEEMTIEQIAEMRARLPYEDIYLEGLVQGTMELMVSEYCVINAFLGGGSKKMCSRPCINGNYALRDRKGEIFPLRTDPYCRMHIMNGHELNMQPYCNRLLKKGLSLLRIEGRHKDPRWVFTMVRTYKDLIDGKISASKCDEKSITRGHYFKGIF